MRLILDPGHMSYILPLLKRAGVNIESVGDGIYEIIFPENTRQATDYRYSLDPSRRRLQIYPPSGVILSFYIQQTVGGIDRGYILENLGGYVQKRNV
jgi:hypothetical protein